MTLFFFLAFIDTFPTDLLPGLFFQIRVVALKELELTVMFSCSMKNENIISFCSFAFFHINRDIFFSVSKIFSAVGPYCCP